MVFIYTRGSERNKKMMSFDAYIQRRIKCLSQRKYKRSNEQSYKVIYYW